MSEQKTLRYHQAIFDHLNINPTISSEAMQLIEEREKVCGITFPPAVKEWYSIEGVTELFYEYTNNDHLTPLEELGSSCRNFVVPGYLCFAVENQGVDIWYVRLDGSDDSPVFSIHPDDWNDWTNEDSCEIYVPEDSSEIYFIFENFSTFIFEFMSTPV